MSEVELSAVPKYAIPCVWAHKEGALIPVRQRTRRKGRRGIGVGRKEQEKQVCRMKMW